MLGQINSKYIWQWIACGKHPAAGDYFQIGASTPLVKAFSDWIEDGYRIWLSKESNCVDLHSWRFWAKGAKKKDLICGLSRDSSDILGRKYPLLIIGAGPLGEWQVHWDLLPFALENTWNQIEYLAAKRYLDFQQLEKEVRMILAPLGDWAELSTRRDLTDNDTFRSSTSHFDLKNFKDIIDTLSDQSEWFFPLTSGLFDEQLKILHLCHFFLKESSKTAPNAVFMGGIPEKSYLAIFNRSLNSNDFVRLWSIGYR